MEKESGYIGLDQRSEIKDDTLIFRLTECIVIFTVASFIGWLYEIAMDWIVWGSLSDRGILHLPLCPIYGFGVLFIMALLGKKKKLIYIFLYGTVISTALELAASYLIEWMFHFRLWTYEHWPFHFQGRISLLSSLIFGVFSVFVIGLICPQIKKRLLRLSTAAQIVLDVVLAGAVILDAAVVLCGAWV